MNAKLVVGEPLRLVASTPSGVAQLRRKILKLAFSGALSVTPGDESVETLMGALDAARVEYFERRSRRRSAHALQPPAPQWDIPETWRWVPLSSVAAIVGGATPDTKTADYWADGPDIPWITPADMRQQADRYVACGQRDITLAGLHGCSAELLPEGAVIFSSRAPIGYVGIANNPLATNQGFKSCVPFLPAMTKYIYWFLVHVGPRIAQEASGTTFKEVSGREMAAVPFPLPPLSDQEQIVAVIENLMDRCQELEARLRDSGAHRDSLRQSSLDHLIEANSADELQRAWLTLRSAWSNVFHDGLSINELRRTILALVFRPSGSPMLSSGRVEEVRLGEVIDFLNGYAFKSEWYASDGLRLLRGQNVSPGALDWSETRYLPRDLADRYDRFRLNEGDLVLALDRPIISTGLKVARVTATDLPCLLLQRVARLSPDLSALTHDYLWWWLQSPQFMEMINPGRSNGIPHISTKDLAKLPMLLPSTDQQIELVEAVDLLMTRCARLELALRRRAQVESALVESHLAST